MRAMHSLFVLLAVSAPAAADPPHCSITRIRASGDSDAGTATSIDVPGVYAKGARWAEYNCRQYSRALASSWIADHGGCGAGHVAFKYTLALGEIGNEQMIEMSLVCPKAASGTAPSASSGGYHAGDKVSVDWHGKYYPASILRVVGFDRYLVHYDNFSARFDEVVGPSRIAGGTTAAPPTTSDADKDRIKCTLVKVKERDLGEKTATVEVDWLKGQKYPDKIPPSSQEILCRTQAMYPAIEWAKDNGLCGANIKYLVELGRAGNAKTLEGGAICNPRKPLGH